MNILISACLMGVRCRYDGSGYPPTEEVLRLMERHCLIPICPEQMGGLPTPRLPVELQGGKALSKDGSDVTAAFTRGAKAVLELAKLYGCSCAILKEKSPSCGSGRVYDGTYSGHLVDREGLTCALLRANGITVVSEEQVALINP